jgi:hypothetical protein
MRFLGLRDSFRRSPPPNLPEKTVYSSTSAKVGDWESNGDNWRKIICSDVPQTWTNTGMKVKAVQKGSAGAEYSRSGCPFVANTQAVIHQQPHACVGEAVDQHIEPALSFAVDPVQVLENEDER